jgi:nucleotide-binding universal stress UspA family protein
MAAIEQEVAMAFRKILIAVGNEPVAARAADVGAELARTLGAEMAFVHVVDSSLGYPADTGVPPDELLALAKQEGKKLVRHFRQRLSPQSAALEFLPVGGPATEIVKTAKEWPADLIVIGSHGRAGVQRALLGSVAEGVMRHAPCPVLVVRAKE